MIPRLRTDTSLMRTPAPHMAAIPMNEGLLPNLKGRLLLVRHLSLNGIKCIVENLIRCILLTVIHQMIHEFRDLLVIEDWIWKDHSLLWFCFSHFLKEKN